MIEVFIKRISNGNKFERLSSIEASLVNGQSIHNYRYSDQQSGTLSYYRISQTNIYGSRNYYKTIQVKMNMEDFRAYNYI